MEHRCQLFKVRDAWAGEEVSNMRHSLFESWNVPIYSTNDSIYFPSRLQYSLSTCARPDYPFSRFRATFTCGLYKIFVLRTRRAVIRAASMKIKFSQTARMKIKFFQTARMKIKFPQTAREILDRAFIRIPPSERNLGSNTLLSLRFSRITLLSTVSNV